MSLAGNPDIARLIVTTIRAYAILILSPDGEILDWLGDAEGVTGYPRDEVIGRRFDMLFTAPDRAASVPPKELKLAMSTGRAEDTRWHPRKDGELYWANGVTLRLDAPEPVLIKIFRDETPAKRAEDQRVLLLNELNHRVKNTLATVQSVIEQTLRASGVGGEVRSNLAGRIIALARAHNVLVDQSWAGANFDVIVRDVVQPYERDPSPFSFSGPSVRLHPSQAVALSMALHELVTNAVKYGALSTLRGRVELSWNEAQNGAGERYLTVLWKETDGPPVTAPTRVGFGTRLIRQSFRDNAGGRVELLFPPDGLSCTMSLRLFDAEPSELLGTEASPEEQGAVAAEPADRQACDADQPR